MRVGEAGGAAPDERRLEHGEEPGVDKVAALIRRFAIMGEEQIAEAEAGGIDDLGDKGTDSVCHGSRNGGGGFDLTGVI